MDLSKKCLVCFVEEEESNLTSLDNNDPCSCLFQSLSHYMDWEPSKHPDEEADLFPIFFCDTCFTRLKLLDELHGKVEGLLQQIQCISLWMTAKIVETCPGHDPNITCEPATLAGSGTAYFRQLTLNKYIAKVRLSPKDCELWMNRTKSPSVKKKGGRKQKIEVLKVQEIFPSEVDSHVPSPPVKKKRGRKKKVDVFDTEEYVDILKNFTPAEEDSAVKLLPFKKKRRRRKKVDVSDTDEEEDTFEVFFPPEDSNVDVQEVKFRPNCSPDLPLDGPFEKPDERIGPVSEENSLLFVDDIVFHMDGPSSTPSYDGIKHETTLSSSNLVGTNVAIPDPLIAPDASTSNGQVVQAGGMEVGHFATSEYNDRIKQVGDAIFSFDDKRFFSLVDNHEWRCCQCSHKTLYKKAILQHFVYSGVKKMCYGKPSKDMVRKCKYKYMLYDLLQNGQFECRVCPYKGRSHKDMKTHYDQKHPKRPVQSTPKSIKQVGPTTFLLRNKVSLESLEDGRFQCGLCLESFPSRNTAQVHAEKVHIPKKTRKVGGKYIVDNCSFEFVHSQYQCGQCSYVCTTYPSILSHVKVIHSQTRKQVCEICGSSYKSVRCLREHQRQVHLKSQHLKCHLCDKAFSTTRGFNKHKRGVHGKKELVCETCGAAFTIPQRLRAHLKTHKKVICDICGMETTEKYFKFHMDSHSDKVFECPVCKKTFKTSLNFYHHRRKCYNSYACDICGEAFAQLKFLEGHKKQVHEATLQNTQVDPPPLDSTVCIPK